MKITKAVYTTESSRVLTKQEFTASLFLSGEAKVPFAPKSWIFLCEVEIDIPDSIIDDIIGTNTEKDINKQIAEYEDKLFKLLKLRDKGDKNA